METLYRFTSKQTRFSTSVILEDEELDAVLEIDDEDIAKENGVDVITER